MHQLGGFPKAEDATKPAATMPHKGSDDGTDTSSCPDVTPSLSEETKNLNLFVGAPPCIVRPVSMDIIPPVSATAAVGAAGQKAEPASAIPRPRSQANLRKMSMSEFELISLLGTGAFSRVVLVEQGSTGKRFAMKVMEKALLQKVRAERIA